MNEISLNLIDPNPDQPRKHFAPETLRELADSIKEHGVLTPIRIQQKNGRYLLVAGERRWRAAIMAGLDSIPAVVVAGLSESEMFLEAIVENVQRDAMDPLEEARAFQRLIDEFGFNMSQIAKKIGRSGSFVKSRLRLLDFEPEIQELMAQRKIPIDPRALDALDKLPAGAVRLRFTSNQSLQGTTIKGFVKACTALKERLEKPGGLPETPAYIQVGGKEPPKPLSWDALRQGGNLPDWEVFNASIRNTCRSCALREQASATICRACPLSMFVGIMVRSAHV